MNKIVILMALIALGWLGGPAAAQDKPVVAIIGTGTLAGTVGPAIGQAGYPVLYGSREPARESVRALVERSGSKASAATPAQAAAAAELIVLAVPRRVLDEVVDGLGDIDGKIVVDVSGGTKRVASDGYLELVPGASNAEGLQARHPAARVVRINLPLMVFFTAPQLIGTPPTVLIAGDDPAARESVARLIFDVGLDPWDAGPLRFARVFDALATMSLVPAQQGRQEGYELKLMPSVPLSCFVDMSELFGFGTPAELDRVRPFPRRDAIVPCDEWRRRLGAAASGG